MFIDACRDEHGVEAICRALAGTPAEIAPSTSYAAKTRPLWDRVVRDAELCEKIIRIHAANYGVYGVGKVRSCAPAAVSMSLSPRCVGS